MTESTLITYCSLLQMFGGNSQEAKSFRASNAADADFIRRAHVLEGLIVGHPFADADIADEPDCGMNRYSLPGDRDNYLTCNF